MKFGEPRPIKAYCLGIYDGPHATPKEAVDGPVFLGIKNITDDGGLDLSEIRHVSEEEYPRWTRRVTPQVGDVVFTYEATLHRYALIPEGFRGCLGRRVALVRPDPARVDSRYLLYFFLSRAWRQVVEGNVITGATVDRVPLERFPEFPAALPGLRVQQEVANILSAYDDLIENNRRRMALLEEAARQLYREWFVRLRFPGHEHTRSTNGVPEGWEKHTLDDLCLIGRGASPRPIADFMGGEVPWFKIGDATASESPFIFRTQEHVTDDGAKKSIMLRPGALILSNSATCGIPYFTAVTGCVHDGWLHFADFGRISPQFLYCFLWYKRDELVSSVGDGSTQKNLNTTAVGRLKLALPQADSLLTQFNEAVTPMFSMVLNLATQNQALRTARDLLLPRLMNGEIAV
jgi:type I restriction enzyme S subunit